MGTRKKAPEISDLKKGSEPRLNRDDARICPQDGGVCWDSCDVSYCEALAGGQSNTPKPRLIRERIVDEMRQHARFAGLGGYTAEYLKECILEWANQLAASLPDTGVRREEEDQQRRDPVLDALVRVGAQQEKA